MTPSVSWPSSLPAPLISGRAFQPIDPTISTPMQSGRTRRRRAFTATPTEGSVSWVMTSAQATAFELFFQSSLKDGVEWFNMELVLPQGKGPWPFQFCDIYDGPHLIGPASAENTRWRYSARLRIYLRPGQMP